MNQKVTHTILLILFSTFVVYNNSYAQTNSDEFKISNGYIDLSNFNLEQNRFVLKGEWDFCKNKLYSPSDFRIANNKELQEVPGLWENLHPKNKQKGFGYGTYRLQFKADSKYRLLSINFNKVQNAYKLWINDSLYTETGIVGTNKKEMTPNWSSKNYVFKNRQPVNEIVIQISNFYHKKGGMEHSPYIGTPEKIENYSWQTLSLDHFIIGLLLIMAIYHFGLFMIKPDEWSVLFFGLTMFSSVMFKLTVGEIAMTAFFPDFSWILLVKMNYIGNFMRVLFFALFIGSLFKTKFRKKTMYATAFFSVIMSIFIAVSPVSIFTHTLYIFLLYAVVIIFFFVGVSVHAVIHKKSGALYSLIGTGILMFAVVNDVVKEILLLNSPSLTTYGLFAFVLLQAYMLSFRSSKSYRTLAKLTKRLLTLTKIKDELLANTNPGPDGPLLTVAKNINVHKALAIANLTGKWQIVAEYMNGKITDVPTKKFLDFENPSKQDYDSVLIHKTIQTKEIQGKRKDEEKGCSTLCVPVTKDNEIISLLYVENSEDYGIFDENNKLILNLLVPQLSVIAQNSKVFDDLAKFNQSLEDTVEERTEEIIQQSEELKNQKEEIEKQNKIINKTYKEIELQNTQISDSINYAQTIQRSVFPSDKKISKSFPNNYIFFKPKDKLSGDFYWTATTNNEGEKYTLFAVADATGHGVPGALMAIIGDSLLNSAVYEKGLYKPSEIIKFLNEELIKRLEKENSDKFESDGINIGVFACNKATQKGFYSGAHQHLYIVNDENLTEYKGSSKTCGMLQIKNTALEFKEYEFDLKKGDNIYLSTDGYSKQIQPSGQKKFTCKDFKKLVVSISQKNHDEQQNILNETLSKIKGTNSQTDDILIAAIKI